MNCARTVKAQNAIIVAKSSIDMPFLNIGHLAAGARNPTALASARLSFGSELSAPADQ